MVVESIREELPDGAIVFDNPAFDNSIIGYDIDNRIVYDYEIMIQELMEDDCLTAEEAADFIEFNTIRSIPYAGEFAPIIMYPVTTI